MLFQVLSVRVVLYRVSSYQEVTTAYSRKPAIHRAPSFTRWGRNREQMFLLFLFRIESFGAPDTSPDLERAPYDVGGPTPHPYSSRDTAAEPKATTP
ncbi:hypothetical protein MTO96_005035 [Rhipicephalus appendiculatus]